MDDNEQSQIEEEFLKSWDWAEVFYSDLGAYYELVQKSMLKLIAELRVRGYDRKLRAGQQMFTFIVSRVRKYGLQTGQARLSIYVSPKGVTTISYKGSDGLVELEFENAEFTPELESLLERLLAHPID